MDNEKNTSRHPLMVETNENYWDCECEEDYIHEKAKKKHCLKCDTSHFDQPDSIQREVEEVIKNLTLNP